VSQGINALLVFGLALDYCVRATAMDALQLGFKVILVKDLCRGVAPDTSRLALTEMASAGIRIIDTISDIL
jgi:nicotinamidase/pyrazinamidase